jgi:hypothetical protein
MLTNLLCTLLLVTCMCARIGMAMGLGGSGEGQRMGGGAVQHNTV